MSGKEWLKEQAHTCEEQYFPLLERAVQTLEGNILEHCPANESLPSWMAKTPLDLTDAQRIMLPPWKPLRGICPSVSHYPGVWNWDSAFHAMTVLRWDSNLAREQIDIFLRNQLASGLLVDALFATGRIVDDFGKPPIMPWAAAFVGQQPGQTGWLGDVYQAFVRYEQFWMRERGGHNDGLFHYYNSLESGWDQSPRFPPAEDDKRHGWPPADGAPRIWPVDLNCYMVIFYRALARMCESAGAQTDKTEWVEKEHRLADAINERLFDETAGCYFDFDKQRLLVVDIMTPASMMPLYIGIARPERAERTLSLAIHRKLFPLLPTVDFRSPAYKSGNGSYSWSGPTWLNVAFFALQAARRYAAEDMANEARAILLDRCAAHSEIYECYDAKTGAPLGAPHFGWSAAFVIEMLTGWQDHFLRWPCLKPTTTSTATNEPATGGSI